jgi:hypothetical protein
MKYSGNTFDAVILQYISSALSIYLESPLRGRPEFDSFLSIFRDRIRNSEAAMGGGAHSAPFGVAMNPKRRVRAAHGRSREAKTH